MGAKNVRNNSLSSLNLREVFVPANEELHLGVPVLARFLFDGNPTTPASGEVSEAEIALRLVAESFPGWLVNYLQSRRPFCMEGAPNSLSLPTLKQWGTLVSHRSASKVEVLLVNKGVFVDEGLDVVTTILEKLSGGQGEIPKPGPEPVTQVSCPERGKVAEGPLVLNLESPFGSWVDVVARFYGTSADEIYSGNRTAKVAKARHVLMFLFRKSLLSWYEIAALVKVRNHTSAIYGYGIILKQVDAMGGVYFDLEKILEIIETKGAPHSNEKPPMELNLKGVRPQRKTAIVISVVSNYYEVGVEQVMGRSRLAHIVKARHVSIFLLKEIMGLSQKDIGKVMGLVDHTSVAHALGKIAEQIEENTALRRELSAVLGLKSKRSEYVK